MLTRKIEPLTPRRVPIRRTIWAARLMYDAHRRTPFMPWHASVTAATALFATLAGAAYCDANSDAVAVVFRMTPRGVLQSACRIVIAMLALPSLALVVTRSWIAAALIAVVEISVCVGVAAIYGVSSRRARNRWLSRPGNTKPDRLDRPRFVPWGCLLGAGVAASTPNAADALCRAIAAKADLAVYLVAVSPVHARLYQRFGFKPIGPSYYGEVPMVLAPPSPRNS